MAAVEVNHTRDTSVVTVVWARFRSTGKIPWPCILQKNCKNDKYFVYCHSDDAILSTRDILPFVEDQIEMWKTKAKRN